jgi:hypothetical protein
VNARTTLRPMEPDNTFTRRVCAVLLADVTGFRRLVGEDGKRAARDAQVLLELWME